MPTSSVPIVRNPRIPIPDGLSLPVDLYRAAAGTRRPAVMVALPYLKDGVAGNASAQARRSHGIPGCVHWLDHDF